jgi:hypothetical protein
VDFGYIATGKLKHRYAPVVRFIRSNQERDIRGFGFGQGFRKIIDLVTRHLSPIRKREMTICNDDG